VRGRLFRTSAGGKTGRRMLTRRASLSFIVGGAKPRRDKEGGGQGISWASFVCFFFLCFGFFGASTRNGWM